MKTVKMMAILCVAGMAMVGCHKDNKMQASPGDVGAKSECCMEKDKSNMGAVGAKKDGCCAEKAAKGNMGAVSDKKASGCCSEKKTN